VPTDILVPGFSCALGSCATGLDPFGTAEIALVLSSIDKSTLSRSISIPSPASALFPVTFEIVSSVYLIPVGNSILVIL